MAASGVDQRLKLAYSKKNKTKWEVAGKIADVVGLVSVFFDFTSSSVVIITAPSPPDSRPARQAGNTV